MSLLRSAALTGIFLLSILKRSFNIQKELLWQ